MIKQATAAKAAAPETWLFRVIGGGGRGLLPVLLLTAWSLCAADVRLPELRTRSATYTNVVVTSQTKTDLMIIYGRGSMGNVKISEIEDDAALIALGIKTAAGAGGAKSGEVRPLPESLTRFMGTNQSLQALKDSAAWAEVEKLRTVKWTPALMAGVGCGVLLLYLFGCYCLKLICLKAGHGPGVLIWLPILQLIPMFRAAGMSGWWLLACFLPLLNLVAAILWAFKIAKVRGKGPLVAVALLLPVLNFFAFLYLAFSSGRKQSDEDRKAPPAKISLGA